MLGGQGMEEAGVRERPRFTREESRKLTQPPGSLSPSTPGNSATGFYLNTLCPSPGLCRPVLSPSPLVQPPPSGFGPSMSSEGVSLVSSRSWDPVSPSSHTPFLPARLGTPTALTWRRLPLALSHLLRQEPTRMLAATSHLSPRPFPGSTKLPEEK